jgi:transposase-like protein
MVTPKVASRSEALQRAQELERTLLPGQKLLVAPLAREWNWSRQTTRTAIKNWRRDGLLRDPGASQTLQSVKKPERKPRLRKGPAVVAQPAQTESPDEAPPILIEPPRAAEPYMPARAGIGRCCFALILAGTAFALGIVGLTLNYRLAVTFGAADRLPGSLIVAFGPSSGNLIAIIAVVLDILTLLLPTVAGWLTEDGERRQARIAWAMFCLALVMTLIAACTFIATNIGDTLQSRADASGERAAIAERLKDLRARRATIGESGEVTQLEGQLLRSQQLPKVLEVWKQTKQCVDVTLPTSATQCEPVTDLRARIAAAHSRDKLDDDIRAADAEFKKLPAVAMADPGAEFVAKALRFVSAGYLPVDAQVIGMIRMAGLAVAPPLGGALLRIAVLVWRPSRRRSGADTAPPRK